MLDVGFFYRRDSFDIIRKCLKNTATMKFQTFFGKVSAKRLMLKLSPSQCFKRVASQVLELGAEVLIDPNWWIYSHLLHCKVTSNLKPNIASFQFSQGPSQSALSILLNWKIFIPSFCKIIPIHQLRLNFNFKLLVN